MPRIQLKLYTEPGEVEIFCKLKLKDGSYERVTAAVDTGAMVSLFPLRLLNNIDDQTSARRTITIDQAGIANQSFEAIETLLTIIFEDALGNITAPLVVPVWFANTKQPLIGFAGVLEHGVLHIDMPKQIGWLEIDSPA